MPLLMMLFALVLGAEPATAVIGTVVEAEDGSPVPYARIGLPALPLPGQPAHVTRR